MRAKLYEKYYKQGINHYLFKEYLGLKKPDESIKRFYYVLMLSMLLMGVFVLN
ncbi:hypothetical protein AB2B38_007930 [Balneola sp. MJW-20]|uniref:hypothetical protein n=1 Tax=Gracilimonas aurantiaca TaxID=3234185 RepID=UPI0034659FF2